MLKAFQVGWFHFFSFPSTELGEQGRHVGGQILLISTAFKKIKVSQVVRLGGLVESLFSADDVDFQFLSTYWPCNNSLPGSFMTRLERFYTDPIASLK
jgi:hypothetical protein